MLTRSMSRRFSSSRIPASFPTCPRWLLSSQDLEPLQHRPCHTGRCCLVYNSGGKNKMRLFILGANGKVGTQLIDLALSRTHQVTAFVRSPEKITQQHPRLQVVRGDPHNVD